MNLIQRIRNAEEGEPGTALVYAICRTLVQISYVRVVAKMPVPRGVRSSYFTGYFWALPKQRANLLAHAASALDDPLGPDNSDS